MRFALFFLIFGTIFTACKDKKLSSQHLSTINVVRETESMLSGKQIDKKEERTEPVPQLHEIKRDGTVYHIIVASFGYSEKSRADKLVENLREKGFPASIINSSQRLRVSIESFNSETEAGAARDEYRKITERQDIWILKL